MKYPNEMSDLELEQEKIKIDLLTHEEMCRLHRFAPAGHKYFIQRSVLQIYFAKRFESFGGMTVEMSKKIGWTQ